jgi:hypothetical protein
MFPVRTAAVCDTLYAIVNSRAIDTNDHAATA